MTKHARTVGLILAIAYAAGGCAAPGYNPPDGPRADQSCPGSQIWVCEDHYPSRLESKHEPPMICRCEDILRIR